MSNNIKILQEIEEDTKNVLNLIMKFKTSSERVEQAGFIAAIAIAYLRGNCAPQYVRGYLECALKDDTALDVEKQEISGVNIQ